MRNLWQLLLRNHVFLLFLVLQVLALTWVTRSHGHPRGRWIQWNLRWTGAWNEQLMEVARIRDLDDANALLVAENAALRARLSRGDADQGRGGEVVQMTLTRSANWFMVNRGSADSVRVGDGVVSSQGAVGRIVETAEHFALGLPLVNTELEWSGRVRRNGVMGRVVWPGTEVAAGQMRDIPRSATIAVGDTVFSTGFQGLFPADVPIGTVKRVTQNPSDEFLTVELNWAVDFSTLRYVELLHGPQWPAFPKTETPQ
jgi:rod shape-determining protein MreC